VIDMPRKWEPAPPDPGIIPGGIRDRAMRALRERGPRPEDPERTGQSQEYWARVRREREALAEAWRNGLPAPPRDPSIWFACIDGGEAVTIGALPEEYSKHAQQLRAKRGADRRVHHADMDNTSYIAARMAANGLATQLENLVGTATVRSRRRR
jgi:hypothetical protein